MRRQAEGFLELAREVGGGNVADFRETGDGPLLVRGGVHAVLGSEQAAQELRGIWVVGNEYLQAAAPWTAIKADRDRAAAITRFGLNLVRLNAVLSRPFLPDASDTMLAAFGLEAAEWPDNLGIALAAVAPGHRFEVPEVLFAKVDDEVDVAPFPAPTSEGWRRRLHDRKGRLVPPLSAHIQQPGPRSSSLRTRHG